MPRLSLPGPPYGLLGGVAPRRHRASTWILRDISFLPPVDAASRVPVLACTRRWEPGRVVVSRGEQPLQRGEQLREGAAARRPRGHRRTRRCAVRVEPGHLAVDSRQPADKIRLGLGPNGARHNRSLCSKALITVYIEQGRVRYSLRPAQATKLRLGINASLAIRNPAMCQVKCQADARMARVGRGTQSLSVPRHEADISLPGFHSMYSDEHS